MGVLTKPQFYKFTRDPSENLDKHEEAKIWHLLNKGKFLSVTTPENLVIGIIEHFDSESLTADLTFLGRAMQKDKEFEDVVVRFKIIDEEISAVAYKKGEIENEEN